jgi:hypothetical protein
LKEKELELSLTASQKEFITKYSTALGGVDIPLPLTASQKEFIINKYSPGTFSRLKPEVNGVPEPYLPESSNTKSSTEISSSSGYSLRPRPAPPLNNVILPGSSSDPAPTFEENKKVRINEYIEEQKISDSGLDNTRKKRYEIIELEPKPSLHSPRHRHREDERDQNTNDNFDSSKSNSNALNIFRGKPKSKFFRFDRDKELRKKSVEN